MKMIPAYAGEWRHISMKNMKKVTLLVWAIVFCSILSIFLMEPMLHSKAKADYNNDILEINEGRTGLYTESNQVVADIMRISTPLYMNFQKSLHPEESNASLFLSNKTVSNETSVSLDETMRMEQQYYTENYGKVKYYLVDNENRTYTNDETLKKYLDPQYKPKETVWYLAFQYDSSGQLAYLNTNSEGSMSNYTGYDHYYGVENDYGESMLPKKDIRMVFVIHEGDIEVPSDLIESSYSLGSYLYIQMREILLVMNLILIAIVLCIPWKKAKESELVQFFVEKVPYELTGLVCFFSYASIQYILSDINSGNIIWPSIRMLLYFLSLIMLVFIGKSFFDKGKPKGLKHHFLTYRIASKGKKIITKEYHYLTAIDFQDSSSRRIFSMAVINFLVASVACLMFVFGIIPLLIYSIFVFYLFSNRDEIERKSYRALHTVIHRIAESDFRKDITENLGGYQPLQEDLQKIQDNFHDAVVQEVRSQNMKTELITNVSHDLKTPLTSIISYIDLLKKENISDEERYKYIDILEKNSDRLKHLIENLFEISKANSGNVTLEYMDVDIVSLMKQVQMECDMQFKKNHLHIRNTFSDEKIIVSLDSLKTFRIFENLICNAGKYAMPKTRVYVTIDDYEEFVEVVIKNISAVELDFDPEGIMERFTRGDKSRNTDGSGLGLAIAKSFTELQQGTMHIAFDGDLFKVTIRLYKQHKE